MWSSIWGSQIMKPCIVSIAIFAEGAKRGNEMNLHHHESKSTEAATLHFLIVSLAEIPGAGASAARDTVLYIQAEEASTLQRP